MSMTSMGYGWCGNELPVFNLFCLNGCYSLEVLKVVPREIGCIPEQI